MKILCIGSATYDITLPTDHYPIENKKIRISNKVECCGGSATICACLLAKWGMETYFAGDVGDDYYGDRVREEMAGEGVNVKYLCPLKGMRTTSSYIIANTTEGTRTILTDKDARIEKENFHIDDNFDVILFDGHERDMAIEVIKKNPKAIKVLDAGAANEARIELGHLVDYLVCSNDFAQEYTGMKMDYGDAESIKTIYDKLKEDFKNNVVITLEAHGCFTSIEGEYIMVPSIKVKAVDSTAAGDIYHGAFTYFIANGFDLEKTLKLSNIAGALSVQKIGGRISIPTLAEVMSKYDEHNL